MDILTTRGQQSLADERVAARWLERRFDCRYLETPKDKPAFVDAIILDNDAQTIRAVVETKCRYKADLDTFRRSWKSEWLVTWQKVQHAIAIAHGLGVPCIGLLYLVDCRTLLLQRLSHADGRLAVGIRLATTETQATVNGGLAVRTNAYIDMAEAEVYAID